MASEVKTISLPNEIWHEIFDNLSSAELYAMRGVNQELRLFVLDYMQRNFRIPHQNLAHESFSFWRIFQEAGKEVVSLSPSSSCGSAAADIDLITMTPGERLALIDHGNQKIATLWKRYGYHMNHLPSSPPYRLEEFQELRNVALREEKRISSEEELLVKIFHFDTEDCEDYFLPKYILLRNLYSELPEATQTLLRYQIYLRNEESMQYAGVVHEDLGLYVIHDAIEQPHSKTSFCSKQHMKHAAMKSLYLLRLKRMEMLSNEAKFAVIQYLGSELKRNSERVGLESSIMEGFKTLRRDSQVTLIRSFVYNYYNHRNNIEIENLARRLFSLLDEDVRENIKHNIFVINGRSMQRGGVYSSEIISTTDLGQHVVDNEFSSLIMLEALRRSRLWLRGEPIVDWDGHDLSLPEYSSFIEL